MQSLCRLLVATALLVTACALTYIPGTQVVDTEENRQVVGVLIEMRKALQTLDGNGLIALVSKTYFEDMGTVDPRDDYGYEHLSQKIVPESMAVTEEFYLTFEIHDIVVDGDTAHADIRYSSRAKLKLPSGTLWDSHKEFNRLRLSREDGNWLITSGL